LGYGLSDMQSGNVGILKFEKIIIQLFVIDLGAVRLLGILIDQVCTAS